MIQIDEQQLDIYDCLELYRILPRFEVETVELRETIMDKLPDKITIEFKYNKDYFVGLICEGENIDDAATQCFGESKQINVKL